MTNKIDFKMEFSKQRTTGTDVTNPMNNLITKKEPEAVKTKITVQGGYLPKKSKRLQLLMTEELYNRVKTAARENEVSVNEFIGQVLNQVV